MKITLLAKSSSGDAYNVEFLADGLFVRVFCHCQAGVLQMMCKHKLALLKGDEKMLFDTKQTPLLDEIRSWPQFADMERRLDDYEEKVLEIERQKNEIARKEKAIKSEFAHGLTFGFK